MGRDVTGLRPDKKPNSFMMNSNGISPNSLRASPKISGERVEAKGNSAKDHTANGSLAGKLNDKQDVLGVKSTNHNASVPEEKTLKLETQKSSDKKLSSPVKPVSDSAANGNAVTEESGSHLPALAAEKQVSVVTKPVGSENADSGGDCTSNSNDMYSPESAKKSHHNSPLASRKLLRFEYKKHTDEEDNCSVASSAATSIRGGKFKTTVPIGPTFKCNARLEKRKEFYTKLEEKHQALEAEKMEYQARTKEEEEAAIKQLRRSMVYKANPVPSFYHEGPPPKAALKKLPVTRAKSPNLTRRKSCGDAAASPESKGPCTRTARHSLGSHKHASPISFAAKSKEPVVGRNRNGAGKVKDSPKQAKETTTKTTPYKMSEQRSANIAVNG